MGNNPSSSAPAADASAAGARVAGGGSASTPFGDSYAERVRALAECHAGFATESMWSAPVAAAEPQKQEARVGPVAAELIKVHRLRGRLARRFVIEASASGPTEVATYDSKSGRETNRYVIGIDVVLLDNSSEDGADTLTLNEPKSGKTLIFTRAADESAQNFYALLEALAVAAGENALRARDDPGYVWEQPEVMLGWLYKKGTVRKALKKRWFVCEKGSGKIEYFSRKLRTKKGEIDLASATSLAEGFHGQFLVVTPTRAWDLHVQLPRKSKPLHFGTAELWLRFLAAESGLEVKGNINSPSRFTSVSLHESLALIKRAGGVMPGGTAAAAAAVAAGGVWADGEADDDALAPFATATMLSPTSTPFGDSYAERAHIVEMQHHVGFSTNAQWSARSAAAAAAAPSEALRAAAPSDAAASTRAVAPSAGGGGGAGARGSTAAAGAVGGEGGGGGAAIAEPAVVADASAAPAAAAATAAVAAAPLASTAATAAAPTITTAEPRAAAAPAFAPFVFGAKPPEPPTYEALVPMSAGQMEAGVVGALSGGGQPADPNTVKQHVARIEMQLLFQAAATAHTQTIRAGRFAAMAQRAEAARRATAAANAE